MNKLALADRRALSMASVAALSVGLLIDMPVPPHLPPPTSPSGAATANIATALEIEQ